MLARFVFCLFFLSLAACSSTKTLPQEEPKAEVNAYHNNPQAALTNVQLGIGYLQQGQMERAKEKLLLAAQQSPNSPEVWGAMAYYQESTGNISEAEKSYRKAISLAPAQGNALNNYGVFLCHRGRYPESLNYFKQAIADPKYISTAQAYENAGLCALKIPDTVSAKAFFTKALQNDANLPASNLELAQIFYKEQDFVLSQAYLTRYNQQGKPSAESLRLSILLSNKKGDKEASASYALMLKESFPLSKEYQQLQQSGIVS